MIMSTLRIVTAPQSAPRHPTLAAQGSDARATSCLRVISTKTLSIGNHHLGGGVGNAAELDRRLRSEDYRVVLAAIDWRKHHPCSLRHVTRRRQRLRG